MQPVVSRREIMLGAATLLGTGFPAGHPRAQGRPLVVGGKNYTEQLLLAEMTTELLQAKGIAAEKRDGLASALLRQAQESGEVDVYWEYTGTSLIVYNKVEEKLSAEQTYQRVKELDAKKGLVWLKPSTANNTFAIAVPRAKAAEQGLRTISDFAKLVNGGAALKFATDGEFARRDDALVGLQKTYDFKLPRTSLMLMDPGLMYDALHQGRVEAAAVSSTDGRVKAFDFTVLEDDKGFFPAYTLCPVARQDALDRAPGLADALNDLASRMNDDALRTINGGVDVERKTVREVAAAFLRQQGLAG
jgi:osmoprotectant transport system substrate-binding protein